MLRNKAVKIEAQPFSWSFLLFTRINFWGLQNRKVKKLILNVLMSLLETCLSWKLQDDKN